MIIGICGVSRSGKDSFFKFSEEYFSLRGETCQQFAFAEELKKDLESFILKKTGISVWTDNTSEKNIIRPLMVEYGKIRRNLTKGRCWIDKLIPKLAASTADYKLITDVRFKSFSNDETDFIKESGGKLIYISRYSEDWMGVKFPLDAANEEEAKNDPLLRQAADYKFSWRDFEGNEEAARQNVFKFLDDNKIAK